MEIPNVKSFNVILYDPNKNKFVQYDVIPYFVNCYKAQKKDKPITYEQMKEWGYRSLVHEYYKMKKRG